MSRSRDLIALAVAVLGTQAAGALSGVAAGGDFKAFFDRLEKPPLTPPAAVFGPVWTTLYLLMGIAAWLVWREGLTKQAALALGLFVAQLALNFAWSLIFFGRQELGWALLEIAVLWLAIVATIVAFWQVRPLAGALLLPYLAWVSFAAYLNAAIWRLN
jgi:tryptophan-rich sensory protein